MALNVNYRSATMRSSAVIRFDAALHGSIPRADRAYVSRRTTQRRRELCWAWLSIVVLVLCWDAAARLDQQVSPPRPRLTHLAESDDKATQNALIPVSARPTVSW